MQTRKIIEDALTGTLVICAMVVTVLVIRDHTARSSTVPSVVRHIQHWRSLAQGRTPVMGSEPSAVVILEFSDYECPFCRNLESNLDAVVKAYPGKVAVVRYDFPLTRIHPHAYEAAIAANCAAAQGVYEPFQASLFSNATNFGSVSWTDLARRARVGDLSSFSECLQDGQSATHVRADEKTAVRLGIHVTPTLVVNGDVIEGAPTLPALKALVAAKARPGRSAWQSVTRWF